MLRKGQATIASLVRELRVELDLLVYLATGDQAGGEGGVNLERVASVPEAQERLCCFCAGFVRHIVTSGRWGGIGRVLEARRRRLGFDRFLACWRRCDVVSVGCGEVAGEGVFELVAVVALGGAAVGEADGAWLDLERLQPPCEAAAVEGLAADVAPG